MPASATRHHRYIEGWGLYANTSARRGPYDDDPYAKMGHSTTMCARVGSLSTRHPPQRWSRDRQSIFRHAPRGVTTTRSTLLVGRQALAYKLGELKIKELRARATKELG